MKTIKSFPFFVLVFVLAFSPAYLAAQHAIFASDYTADEAFEYRNLLVPEYELVMGGPGKDGIPAIDFPAFTRDMEVYLPANDAPVLAISHNGVEKAYPLSILAYHEVVNDDFGGQSVVVTYSPLCGSGTAFVSDRTDADESWQFGVSGLLHNNNLVLFDRATNALWCQLTGVALSGELAGTHLQPVPVRLTTWGAWQDEHPTTKVLTADTGFKRNYSCDPYATYADNDRLRFPVTYHDARLATKERVLGVAVNGQYKAYPYSLLAGVSEDVFNGQELQFHYEASTETAYATYPDGSPYPAVSTYWFAWYNFYPATDIHGVTPEVIQTAMSMVSPRAR